MNGMILTDSGKKLAVEAFLGNVLTFTRAEIGEGIVNADEDPRTFTKLKSPYKNISINSSSKVGESSFKVRASFTNEDFDKLVNYRELGLYAKINDGEEVLYSYRNSGDIVEPIPAFDGTNKVSRVVDLINYIGDADNVKIEMSSEDYATTVDFEEIKTYIQAITGTTIEGYLQDFTSVTGGKGYIDKTTKKLFLPANLKDGETKEGNWTEPNTDWKEFTLNNNSNFCEELPVKLKPVDQLVIIDLYAVRTGNIVKGYVIFDGKSWNRYSHYSGSVTCISSIRFGIPLTQNLKKQFIPHEIVAWGKSLEGEMTTTVGYCTIDGHNMMFTKVKDIPDPKNNAMLNFECLI